MKITKPIKNPLIFNQLNINKNNKPIIVLDAGHGGFDYGAISNKGTREKDIVLKFVKKLQKKLLKTKKFKVFLTRKGDYFIKLRDRVKISRKYKANLFISVHVDSVINKYSMVQGASIYTLSDTSSDEVVNELTSKKDRLNILPGLKFKNKTKNVAAILINLAQRDSKNKSIKFAKIVINQMKGKIITRKKPIKFAGFRVLKAPDIPSVLIELGYLSNYFDEQNLKSDIWQNKMINSIKKSIIKYFE